METYEQLLERAYEKVKIVEGASGRFDIPKVIGQIEGKSTIITNIAAIAGYIRRDLQHLVKFLQKELAAPGKIENDRLILQTRLNSARVNEKIQLYAKEFVICPVCQKPDTEIIAEHGIKYKHCLACGAKSPIKHKI
ncbi:translation initiation factor IF-2 subunit beta [Candidatus Pacearchaeota archaeon]|nr:translation initiation factor IF-2 subunit beta [Candidatus Pacearchaeota archaeon]